MLGDSSVSGDNKSPLVLSSAQQSWLAEVSAKAASVRRAFETGAGINAAELGDWFASHVVDGNLQRDGVFSELYDKLHRTGANF